MNEQDMKTRLAEALTGADDGSLPPEVLTDWEPTERLGRSEHSETLLVRNRKSGERAVAKLLKGEMTPRLAETLRGLSHPALPKVLAVIPGEERTCILRAWVEGTPLADSGRAFTPTETADVAAQLCAVLGYLHALTPPVIHRDVKPENIILGKGGRVTLIDFGIARLYQGDAENDTRVMGTERYAPPEQYGFHQTDQRSDLYALGVVMGWMLTGSARTEDHAAIPDPALRRIVQRCTAFDPQDRYPSAAALKKALRSRGKSRRKGWLIAAAACVLVLIAGLCVLAVRPMVQPVTFTEPLIEQAVRLALGKSDDAPLTAKELNAVEGLYIFGNAVCADQDSFYSAASSWYASDTKARGPITSLEDVKQLPNLRFMLIAANHLTDLSPLSGLTKLEKVEFKHNSIAEITPLKGLNRLSYVGLNDNPVTDISPLAALPNLRYLDLCDASSYDPGVIGSLGDFDSLNISNRTDSWMYLGTRTVHDLRLGWSGIDTLDALAGVSGLIHLEIEHTGITDLSGIEAHTELAYLRITDDAITDLSPLLKLPKLETLVIGEELREAAEGLGAVHFAIQYE